MHPLENPVWHALTGPQATLAEGLAGAARYVGDVAPFAAVPDEPSDEDWAALAELVGSDGVAVLFRSSATVPPGWSEATRIPAAQMVATMVAPAPLAAAVELGSDDVPDMLALVELAQPGPFGARTIELGTYLGVREGGELVAMAGERVRLPGWREISAVATHPEHRRRGLGGALVLDLVGRIRAAGDEACLHVVAANVNAIRLYETLGFTTRTDFFGTVVRPP